MIRHVIWDWNGTLLDDTEACVNSVNRMLEVRRFPLITVEAYRQIFDFPVIRYYEKLGFNLATENWDAIAVEFHRHYAEYARHAPLRHGIEHVLATLSETGFEMSILSASEINILNRMLTEHGIRNYFRHISGLDNLHAASKLENGKMLIRQINLPADDVILVGDPCHDHDVATAMGIRCMLLTGGHQHESRLPSDDMVPSTDVLIQKIRSEGQLTDAQGVRHAIPERHNRLS